MVPNQISNIADMPIDLAFNEAPSQVIETMSYKIQARSFPVQFTVVENFN